MALAAAVFCSRASAADFQLPASYNDFKLSTAYSSLNEAIKAESFIIIPPGEYEIENPIVIDQDRPLYLLGVARQRVHLVPMHVKEPMFIVKRAPFVKCAYFSMGPTTVVNDPKLDLGDKMHGHRELAFQAAQ